MLGFGADGQVRIANPLAGETHVRHLLNDLRSGSDPPQVTTLLGHLALVLQEVWHDGSA